MTFFTNYESTENTNDVFDFYPAAYNLFFLILLWSYQWYCIINTANEPEPEPLKCAPKTLLQIQQEYSEKYLSKFLDAASQESDVWNSNIDAAFRDKEVLADIMKDPDNELEKQWKRRVVIEFTPRGNVCMFYNIYKQTFSYYCDQAVMPYEIMNAVAMKYVMTFHCLDFFVDSGIMGKPVDTEAPAANEPEQKKEPNKNVAAFAQFKKYNTSAKRAEISKEDEKIINRFLHLGPIRNWSITEKPKRINPLNGFKTDMIPSDTKLSYQEYKQMNQNAAK